MKFNMDGFVQKRLVIAVIILVLLIAGGIMVVKKKKAELASVPPPEKALTPVETVSARWGEFAAHADFLGTIKPKISAEIAPRITARIIEVRVREGRIVKKGEVLARLDDREQRYAVSSLEARLSAARTALSTREAIYNRDRKLFEAKAISREALDLSTTTRDAARAEVITLEKQLDSARTALSYTILRALFDGCITARLMEPGDMGLPGKPVVAMEAPDAGYYVEVKVPQRQIPALKLGDEISIFPDAGRFQDAFTPLTHDAPSSSMHAVISRIHPAVRTGTLGVIEADVDKRPFGLPSGSAVNVRITTGRYQGLGIPLRALLENVNGAAIFTVNDGAVHVIPVSVLYRGADMAVVTPVNGRVGMSEITVITAQESALLRLHEGQKVRVSRAPSFEPALSGTETPGGQS